MCNFILQYMNFSSTAPLSNLIIFFKILQKSILFSILTIIRLYFMWLSLIFILSCHILLSYIYKLYHILHLNLTIFYRVIGACAPYCLLKFARCPSFFFTLAKPPHVSLHWRYRQKLPPVMPVKWNIGG